MRTLVAVVLGASCAILAVCPADRPVSPDAGAIATNPAADRSDIEATLQRSRLFETQRGVRVNLSNDGDSDVRVEAVRLESPWFESVPPDPRDPVLRAGDGPVAMPLSFGEARCEGDTDDPTLVILTVDGEEVTVTAEESPPGLLAGLRDAECDVAAVRQQVDLRLGDRWERTGPRTVVGALDASQLEAGAAVTVLAVEGNVIFGLDLVAADPSDPPVDPSDPLAEIDDDQTTASIEIGLTAARCDPHALIEYKRTFIFVALVDTGDGEPVRVDVTAEGAAQTALQASLEACIG
jgi:hypothetical protein